MIKNKTFILFIPLLMCFFSFAQASKSGEVILPESFPECPVQRVTDAILTSDNVIWVIGEQSGIYTFDLKNASNGKWTQVSNGKNFDPSTNYYAIVEDKQGRIWIGTDNRGVIVYNGHTWQSYTIENTLLSNRIYNMAVSPLTGEIGIATSGGVSIYNPVNKSWKDLTRGNGLIEDQVRALTFSEDGCIWFAYACGGLTQGSLKHSPDSWKHIIAPWIWDKKGFVRQPLSSSGSGLPSNLCNDVISSSGTIWIATCAGIAYSPVKRTSWKYIRGFDYLEKNKGLYNPDKLITWETSPDTHLLPQDYISALAPAKQGLWVGTRDQGIYLWSRQNGIIKKATLPDQQEKYEITTLLNFPDGSIGYGTSGKGFGVIKNGSGKWKEKKMTHTIPGHPEIPPIPTEQQIADILMSPDKPSSQNDGIYIGEDWMTKGDWPGRYGNVYALLCAGEGVGMDGRYPTKLIFGNRKKYLTEDMYVILQEYNINDLIGPHYTDLKLSSSIVYDSNSKDRNALFSPHNLTRKEAIWDDTGNDYLDTWDGPDLWVRIVVPDGVHLIDLYFYNTTDSTADSFKADYYIEMRKDTVIHDEPRPTQKKSVQHIANLYSFPVSARARVRQFSGSGVYHQFATSSKGTYWFRICKNNSPSAKLNGVFISKLIFPLKFDYNAMKEADIFFSQMPPLPPRLEEDTIKDYSVFCERWEQASQKKELSASGKTLLRTGLLYQYRKLSENKTGSNLKERLAWDLRILNERDRAEFDQLILNLKKHKEASYFNTTNHK